MSTAVQTRPVHFSEDVPLISEAPEHYFMMGNTTFHCIRPDCDLKCHWWCSCHESADAS